ncbi:MAG TPA: ATP-grasp domain-containing protein [Symbiobacteriaceae bacterium]|nr:ATP-grasp domain-containing protein [Symbiobacteriaceae bacterium]
MGLTVGLMYNLGKNEPPEEGEPPDAHAELDSEQTVKAIAAALTSVGHEVVRIEGDEEAYPKLRAVRPDIVFNICEGLRGESRESQIPALLEMLGIPYTGSGVLALALSLDKAAAKKMLLYHGVPTPAFKTIAPGEMIDWNGLRFPLFVKPANEGSSMGITPDSKVDTPSELVERVQYVHDMYRQAALVEEFIDGREFTVGLVGNENPTIFPIMELNYGIVPTGHGNIYSYQFKKEWDADEYYLCPAPVDQATEQLLKRTAFAAFRALGCVDVARVDIRMGADGIPYVLEVNALPGLSPGFSDLCRQADKGGYTYEQLVNSILDAALQRWRLAEVVRRRLAETAD